MNATILHESRGRIRFQLQQKRMTLAQADLLEAWLQGKSWTRQVTVHERTRAVILYYEGDRQRVLNAIRQFSWQKAEQTVSVPAHSSRALNREFEEKLVGKILCKAASTLFLPPPLRIARILWHMIPFIGRGLRCFCLPQRFQHRRDGDVSAGSGRTAGGMDPEKVGGGSGPFHVPQRGPSLAAHSAGRSSGSHLPGPAGGCRNRPRRRHHSFGRPGAGG